MDNNNNNIFNNDEQIIRCNQNAPANLIWRFDHYQLMRDANVSKKNVKID
jgi:hypothetical protein